MAVSPLTAQLPALAGALPDLFRRHDNAASRADEPPVFADSASDAPNTDERRATTARSPEETTRMLARRAALGPLTYGRRTVLADAPAAAPVGMRGTHLDVRG